MNTELLKQDFKRKTYGLIFYATMGFISIKLMGSFEYSMNKFHLYDQIYKCKSGVITYETLKKNINQDRQRKEIPKKVDIKTNFAVLNKDNLEHVLRIKEFNKV